MSEPSGTLVSAERAAVLVDTSVAVALVLGSHEHHAACRRAVNDRPVGLAGHAAFETFSVLTRLPSPSRRSPDAIVQLLTTNFPETRFLSTENAVSLLIRLGRDRVAGGSVYDALVGAVAVEHELVLLSRDWRAQPTYRALGVQVEVVGDRGVGGG